MTPLVLLALAADPLPAAVRDHRLALAERPWDAAVQAGLEACRGRVAYPDPPEPSLRVRPAAPAGLRHRVGPLDLLLASTAGSLLLGVGLAARLSVRPGWATPIIAAGGVTLATATAAGWAVSRPVDAGLVIAEPTPLRTGNGTSYPARLTLPAGAEVTELHRRGGWVQVEVAGGAAGWVRAATLLGD
jgi:hypothetical protein